VARFVGQRHPPLASDLLSAVQLAEPVFEPPAAPGSTGGILRAFFGTVAGAVGPMDVRSLVPLRPAAAAGIAGGGSLLILLTAAWLLPASVGKGLGLLSRVPSRFEGAVVSDEPLIGEVRISYQYPAYTRLPARVVEGSTGDIVAVRGTRVTFETKLLRSARDAMLLFGDQGEGGELRVRVSGGQLKAALTLDESTSFRVWLAPLFGRPVRENRAHRMVAEVDQPPRVEIFGPADRLELPTPRPIEVGFSAGDDFGVQSVDLVYRVDDGAEQRVHLKDVGGARSAQGRTVFEPNLESSAPGVIVAYRVEARDNDAISGRKPAANATPGKLGSSRTLYVVIQDPRENLDEQILRERDVLDKLLENLGDRLEALEIPPAAAGPSVDLPAKLAMWLALHESEESQVAALGRVIDDERRAGSSAKTVLASLSSIADRLSRRLREESGLLGALKSRSDDGTLGTGSFDRLYQHGGKHVEDLETAVLMLDDLIGRQRLEDLADLAKSLTETFKRLQDLLSRYQATKDEALRRQLEREIRDLKSRISQLAQKIDALKARNEVATEWQNLPDMKKAAEQANQFSNLLEKGDPSSLQKALSELGGALSEVRKMLENNAESFGESRFQQENKTMAEALRKLGDLEGDERSLAGDSNSLAQEMDEKLAKEMSAEMDRFVAETREKLETLRNRLGTPAPRELGEDGTDELKRAQESARQMRRLLPEREWGEVKKEAERAVSSLRRLRKELDDKNQGKRPPSGQLEEFNEAMGEARGIAQQIAQDLEKLTPKPGDRMSAEQKARSQGMSQRQKSLAERARELAEEAAGNAGKAPGLDRASEELKGIGQQMGESQQDLGKGNTREGSGKARDAADRLAKLRDSLQDGQKGQNGRNRREPVRIPGADESKAPREWRQELMEAMREKAPDSYSEEVRKYYEELVK
jgi:DNA repair exonuclease SbcCD ATPase subunit